MAMASDPISTAITVPAGSDDTPAGARHPSQSLRTSAVSLRGGAAIDAPQTSPLPQRKPWALPPSGLAVFYGRPETPRLFHYFLPRLLAEGKQVLCLDGANRFDPLLIARLARQRGIEAAEFNRHIRVARAFTCFQLTELLVRVPRLLEKFVADALIVTALPDLYFDEDVRERDAGVAFRHALDALRALRPLPLGVAVFTDATSFETPRRVMFEQLAAQANELWRFALDGKGGKLHLIEEKSCGPGLLSRAGAEDQTRGFSAPGHQILRP
jgi:hypothetical protein